MGMEMLEKRKINRANVSGIDDEKLINGKCAQDAEAVGPVER